MGRKHQFLCRLEVDIGCTGRPTHSPGRRGRTGIGDIFRHANRSGRFIVRPCGDARYHSSNVPRRRIYVPPHSVLEFAQYIGVSVHVVHTQYVDDVWIQPGIVECILRKRTGSLENGDAVEHDAGDIECSTVPSFPTILSGQGPKVPHPGRSSIVWGKPVKVYTPFRLFLGKRPNDPSLRLKLII